MKFIKFLLIIWFTSLFLSACSGGGGGGTGTADAETGGATADWPVLFAAYQSIKAGTSVDQVSKMVGFAPNLPVNDFGTGKGAVRWKAGVSNAILGIDYDESGGAISKVYAGPNGTFGEYLY